MTKHLITRAFAAAALLAGAAWTTPALLAQGITEVSRTPMADAAQITFGYLCDDRFVVRNDGTQPVSLEYGLEKGTEHTKLELSARESVELESRSKAGIELWKDGKRIAVAEKDKRSCKDVQGNASVTVTPLEVTTAQQQGAAPYSYGWYDPYFGPWGYAGFYDPFYGPFYRPYVGAVIRVPIVVGRGGGRRR